MKKTRPFAKVFLLSLFLALFVSNTSAQKVTLSFQNETFEKVLNSIKQQTGLSLVFSEQLVNLNRKVSIDVNSISVEDALKQLLIGTGLGYEIKNNKLYLVENKSTEQKSTFNQSKKLTGLVTDEKGDPIIGASVIVKGSNTGTITNINGEFAIEAPEQSVVTISYIGYKQSNIKIGGQNNLKILLEEDNKALDEIVVVGYGTQKKINLTGAVSTLKTDKIREIPVSNMSSLLSGRISGVSVVGETGNPGVSSTINIRSQSSWNYAPPLFVIDGVIRDKTAFDNLDPNEISDISVLKDAASAAVYGARSSNGVFVITTKRGALGKPVITYNGNYSMETPVKIIETLGAVENAKINNTLFNQSNANAWSDEELAWLENNNFNWLNEVYRNPFSTNHSLSVSGGNEQVRYYVGGTFYKQGSFLNNLDYNKYNIRANIDANISKNLSANLQISSNYSEYNSYNFSEDQGANTLASLWGRLNYLYYDVPCYIDGKPVKTEWFGNAVEILKNSGYRRQRSNGMNANMTLNYKIPGVEGLAAHALFSQNTRQDDWKIFNKFITVYDFKRAGDHSHIVTNEVIGQYQQGSYSNQSLQNNYNRNEDYQLNLSLSYQTKIKKHNIDALLLYEQSEGTQNGFWGRRENFPVILSDQYFATSDDRKDSEVNGNESEWGRISYLTRVNYNFDEKYLISGSLRRDGSMLFAPDKRWGWFPAVSAGWRISEEPFFKNIITAFNSLKIRGSFGLMGSDAVGGWQWMERYLPSNGFMFGADPAVVKGIEYGGIVNKDLTWEKSLTSNIGLDAQLKNGFNFELDVWSKSQYDILGSRIQSLPTTFGAVMPAENYGKVDSKGIEVGIDYNGKFTKDFTYTVRANFAWATNKVILKDVAENVQDVNNPIGRPLNYIVGLLATDIIRTQEDLDKLPTDYTIFNKTPQLGMINYQDLSGALGAPDNKIDIYDQTVINQYSVAPYTGGLTFGLAYKGIGLEVFFDGKMGHKKIYNDGYRMWSANSKNFAIWRDHWSPENPNATMPKPNLTYDEKNDYTQSTFWMYNGSFARLRNLNLSYTLPTKLTKVVGIQSVRIYSNFSNLFYLTAFKFYDPEVSGAGVYPNMKSFTLGLSLTL